MTEQFGFELVDEQRVEELATTARLWKHSKTGAQVLSMNNADENKVFGVSFRTPPSDSTGVAHILEHSVLCGSEKFPVKEPFVELLKGSLQTFLNAFTYPDKTCYPVASTNVQDFYNLIDVYLDATFFPLINEQIFQQEGWHYNVEKKEDPLTYRGVVYNEMRGVYSSPDSVLYERSQQSLFPDMTYGLDSGGNPDVIPELTYEQFKNFHETYYHPSNGRFFFWGDDDEAKRLEKLAGTLDRFSALEVDSHVPLQEEFERPVALLEGYAAGPATNEHQGRAMFTVNWLLPETAEAELNLAFQMLEQILVGTPASPLRKALIESGLGEDVTGTGLENELRQMYFSTGLSGIKSENADVVEALIFDTLNDLVKNGIDKEYIEAAVNSIEFGLRENNSGRFPVGLSVMVRSLTTWLYDADPLALISFEEPLGFIKERLANGDRLFEDLISAFLVGNNHRTTVLLVPDEDLQEVRTKRVDEKLAKIREEMSEADVESIVENTALLRKMQQTPDSDEAVASIPRLTLSDIPTENKTIPQQSAEHSGVTVYTHDLDTNGVVYASAAFDVAGLDASLLPYVPLFGRCLTEVGTDKLNFVELGMRIAAKTGGISADLMTATTIGEQSPLAKLVVHGKSTEDKVADLFDLLQTIVLDTDLDNMERFRSIVLEEKARVEQGVVPSGHMIVMSHLRGCFDVAGWISEQTGGVSYLAFLRSLADKISTDWNAVLADLEQIRATVLKKADALISITAEASGLTAADSLVKGFIAALPERAVESALWKPEFVTSNEAFLIPAQVNYVGKGADLYALGYKYHGSANVIFKHLRMGWLWDQVRVQGGAYGAFAAFDRSTGVLAQVSYRDPNLENTLKAFDGSAAYLANVDLSKAELEKAIIGAIGDLDTHMLPDAKGSAAVTRKMLGDTDEIRQQMRDEILSTTLDHFHSFADVLHAAAENGRICVLGGNGVREAAEVNGWNLSEIL
ncbi:insulinase family protein [Halodesulfovibrio sp.]|jgi:Zn-dependent M16 (insulinase) family peptidase|uniref:insulinase family protein n=1 Tax=Halodesulfovibrio sp. TaxID=1912772 RepID=UPI0025EDCBC7|nr:insulinase family protein [Halodesulfovibrio sp.]MCT4628247.1 insulinase family protein [Halodesulfovibrio sp.]